MGLTTASRRGRTLVTWFRRHWRRLRSTAEMTRLSTSNTWCPPTNHACWINLTHMHTPHSLILQPVYIYTVYISFCIVFVLVTLFIIYSHTCILWALVVPQQDQTAFVNVLKYLESPHGWSSQCPTHCMCNHILPACRSTTISHDKNAPWIIYASLDHTPGGHIVYMLSELH